MTTPVRDARIAGAVGFGKGVGRGALRRLLVTVVAPSHRCHKGVLGVAVKPAVGVIDAVTDLTVGIKNMSALADRQRPLPVRLPRACRSTLGMLPAYDADDAFGAQLCCAKMAVL